MSDHQPQNQVVFRNYLLFQSLIVRFVWSNNVCSDNLYRPCWHHSVPQDGSLPKDSPNCPVLPRLQEGGRQRVPVCFSWRILEGWSWSQHLVWNWSQVSWKIAHTTRTSGWRLAVLWGRWLAWWCKHSGAAGRYYNLVWKTLIQAGVSVSTTK